MAYSEELSPAEALSKFLLDIDCLDEIKQQSKFNPFDVLQIARAEIRHSNVLSWLFDPSESHGLGHKVLSGLIGLLVKERFVNETDALKLLTLQYSDIVVYREWKNIDILIESIQEKFVICIENKIGTKDHSNQLDRYYDIVHNKYNNDSFTKVFLYLTPDGSTPQEDSNQAWNIVKYEDIVSILEKTVRKTSPNPQASAFIEDYLEILRRETMEDHSIAILCQKIYKEHKAALDLIYEYRPDRLQYVSDYFKAWCLAKQQSGEIIFVAEKSSKSHCRFRTQFMNQLVPYDDTQSGWRYKNHYFYEIKATMNDDEDIRYHIQLVLNSTNLSEERRRHLESIDSCLTKKGKIKDGWVWRTVYATPSQTIKGNEELPEDMVNNPISKQLDTMLKTVIQKQKLLEHMA